MPLLSQKNRRLSITPRQLAEKAGGELLSLLCDVLADGKLTSAEIERLRVWLRENSTNDIPGIPYLADLIEQVLADGILSESEKTELHLAMEKVLPVIERTAAKSARLASTTRSASSCAEELPKITRGDLKRMKFDAKEESQDDDSAFGRWWRDDPMTDAQRAFIKSLGGTIPRDATKGEASDSIVCLLRQRPISRRQEMILRFWKRPKGGDEGPREISEWMNSFYLEDPDRKSAWDLFKQESEDDGLQGDPARVPLGIGPEYLARVKAGGGRIIPRFQTAPMKSSIPAKTGISRIWISGFTVVVMLIVGTIIVGGSKTSNSVRSPGAEKIKLSPLKTSRETVPDSAAPNISSRHDPAPEKIETEAQRALRVFATSRLFNGIIGGSKPRALLDGQTFRVGEIIGRENVYRIVDIDPLARTVQIGDTEGNIFTLTLQ